MKNCEYLEFLLDENYIRLNCNTRADPISIKKITSDISLDLGFSSDIPPRIERGTVNMSRWLCLRLTTKKQLNMQANNVK